MEEEVVIIIAAIILFAWRLANHLLRVSICTCLYRHTISNSEGAGRGRVENRSENQLELADSGLVQLVPVRLGYCCVSPASYSFAQTHDARSGPLLPADISISLFRVWHSSRNIYILRILTEANWMEKGKKERRFRTDDMRLYVMRLRKLAYVPPRLCQTRQTTWRCWRQVVILVKKWRENKRKPNGWVIP